MTTLKYGDNGWRVAEWQLAIGAEPTGHFSIKTHRATLMVQAELGLQETGIADAETVEKHGLTPLHLREIQEPERRVLASVDYLARQNPREWNPLALLVTRGERGDGSGYDWNQDWVSYHARVCGVTWGDACDPELGALVRLKDGRQGIIVLCETDRVRISLAPILGGVASMRIVPDQVDTIRQLELAVG